MPNDPPAAMRERFEQWANAKGTMGNSWNGEYYENNLHEAAWQAWQAAHPSSEKIEEVAKRLVEAFSDRGRTFDNSPDQAGVAAILREELGGGK